MKNIVFLLVFFVALNGYSKDILLKIQNSANHNPISFVKVTSGNKCVGYTDQAGEVKIDETKITDNIIQLEKSIYHKKEFLLNDDIEIVTIEMKHLDADNNINKSQTELFCLIDDVLKNSRFHISQKEVVGLFSYHCQTSLKSESLKSKQENLHFILKRNKIKTMDKIEKSTKKWLMSLLKSEPVRYPIYKSLKSKPYNHCSIIAGYNNLDNDRILHLIILNEHAKTELIINETQKVLIEFHQNIIKKNEKGLSDPDYHAIYSCENSMFLTEMLTALYTYTKLGETDLRQIQVCF